MSGAIVLVLSSGWGVRTFLQTEVLERLLQRAPVALLAAPDLLDRLRERWGDRVELAPLRPFDPTRGELGRLRRRRNDYFQRLSSTGTRRVREAAHAAGVRNPLRRLDLRRRRLQAALLATPERLARLAEREREAFFREYPAVRDYEELFARWRPSLVVATVPHLAAEAPPVLVAQRLGIATASWINSWDNLTSKPAYFTGYDHYFLWSERMREELLRYYPEARGREVTATGVPHFDWYRRPAMVGTREELCARLGLDPSRPLLFYATATPHLAPAEDLIVKRLAREVAEGSIPGRPQLVVRLHPGDAGGRFRDWPREGARLQIPGGEGRGALSAYCPTPEDNRDLVQSVAHADVVINLASTITIEAALCDRPTVNVAYDLGPGRRFQAAIDRYYDTYDHYRTVLEHGAVRVARSHEELLRHVADYLENPALEREGRARLARLWCGPADGRAAERLADGLLAAAGAGVLVEAGPA
jgi:hypothetical protein